MKHILYIIIGGFAMLLALYAIVVTIEIIAYAGRNFGAGTVIFFTLGALIGSHLYLEQSNNRL